MVRLGLGIFFAGVIRKDSSLRRVLPFETGGFFMVLPISF